MGPPEREIAAAREARLELAWCGRESRRACRCTSSSTPAWAAAAPGAAGAGPDVVGLMTHLATADSDPVFAERQLERSERRPSRTTN